MKGSVNMMEYYIGIDLGTSSVKLMLVDGEGTILRSAVRTYPVSYPKAGWSEQSPEDWWNGVEDALGELLANGMGKHVRGIGIAGQMHGLVVLDENDNVIRPAILWNDGRTAEETDFLNEIVGKDKLFSYTGNTAFAGFTAPKLLWMRENEPENFVRIKKIMLPKDYVNYRLTGEHTTDYSDASGMLLLDVKEKRWSPDMLSICGIREEMLPRLMESYDAAGTLLPAIAERFGIPHDAVVVAGAGDNAAAAVGTGTVGAGKCNISLGTSGTIFASDTRFSGDPGQAIHSFCHADGGYHLMGCILSAASCNKWFQEEILGTVDYAAREKMMADALRRSHHHKGRGDKSEVFFLPYLMGERSPINDTDASGLFIGLRPNTTSAEMQAAVLEGVAFAIKENLDVMAEMGVAVSKSTLCGGGARSVLWQKILANVLNIELVLPAAEEGPGYGAAMLAMVGSGRYDDVAACADALVKTRGSVQPTPELAEHYAKRYSKYRAIYPAVKALYKVLE